MSMVLILDYSTNCFLRKKWSLHAFKTYSWLTTFKNIYCSMTSMSDSRKSMEIADAINQSKVVVENKNSMIWATDEMVSWTARFLILFMSKLKLIFWGPTYILAAYFWWQISHVGIYMLSERAIFLAIQSRMQISWTRAMEPEQSQTEISGRDPS